MTRRVLIVDDESDIREIAALTLAHLKGWEVTEAGSAAEAYALALAEPPDVVLLDVMMPGKDGPAALADLRADERTRAIPVVFLTAKSQRREREDLLSLGATGVLAKPFDPMLLGDDLAALLGWES